MSCEDHLYNMIRLHTVRGNFKKVYDMIESSTFTDCQKAIKLWDEAHYTEKEMELGRPLNAVMKFRIREKNPPPPHLCGGERSKICLPKRATKVLRSWLQKHKDFPYPSRVEKQKLADQTQLTVTQVQTWFSNTRRRNSELLRNTRRRLSFSGFNNHRDQSHTKIVLAPSNTCKSSAFVEVYEVGDRNEAMELGTASHYNTQVTFEGCPESDIDQVELKD